MRLLYLDWPHLPFRIEAARTPLPELVVIGGQPWEKAAVLDYSPAAGRLGVRHGQPVGSAHKLAPDARFLSPDEQAYDGAMEAVLQALAGFTPALEGESRSAAPGFGRLLLGIEGLHRLWGDEPTLAARVMDAVRPLLPGNPRAGVGNTRFGAQVAAVVGAARRAVIPESVPAGDAAVEAAYLAPLPIRLLPADDELRERLRVFGLTRIGELAALPRAAVVARFGAAGGLLHDLARGLDGRPLRPRRPVERLRAEAELEPPVEELEPLRFVLRHLAGALCEQLAARGAGASRAVLRIELERAEPVSLEQFLPEPAAAPDLLERLLLARLDWQLVGLELRFGADRLFRPRIVDPEAALPEQRIEWCPATAEVSSGRSEVPSGRSEAPA